MSFTFLELSLVALVFTWIGFIRAGLGFGGAVLGLPILMLIGGSPIDWLPIIGIHLLFFSSITGSLPIAFISVIGMFLVWILWNKVAGSFVLNHLKIAKNIIKEAQKG